MQLLARCLVFIITLSVVSFLLLIISKFEVYLNTLYSGDYVTNALEFMPEYKKDSTPNLVKFLTKSSESLKISFDHDKLDNNNVITRNDLVKLSIVGSVLDGYTLLSEKSSPCMRITIFIRSYDYNSNNVSFILALPNGSPLDIELRPLDYFEGFPSTPRAYALHTEAITGQCDVISEPPHFDPSTFRPCKDKSIDCALHIAEDKMALYVLSLSEEKRRDRFSKIMTKFDEILGTSLSNDRLFESFQKYPL